MKRILVLLFVLQLLFACNSNSDKNKANETQSKVQTSVTDSSVNITYAKTDMENESVVPEAENSIEEEAKPLSGIISKSGNISAERGIIENEDEALKLRRARTAFSNGNTYYKQGELDKAIEAFKTSLEHKPDNDKAFYNLGMIYYDQEQKGLSLSYYKDAVRINPGDSLSLVAIGLLYYEKGDMAEAVKYYNQTIEVAPHFSMVYFNRGTMYGQNKNYEQSLEDLTKAIQYDEQNSEAYINRGLAYFYTKQMELACKDWKKAAAMGNPKGTKAVDIYCSGKENK